MYSTEIVRIPTSYGAPPNSGNLGLYVKPHRSWGYSEPASINWHGCRESFHEDWLGYKSSDLIYYCHDRNKGQSIGRFIARIESRLGLKTRTEIGPTQRVNVSWVKVAPWWHQNEARRTFFSIVLRAARRYNPSKRNFNEALYTNKYGKQTRPAIEYFLKGHTRYSFPRYYFDGWCETFKKLKLQEVSKLLIK